MVKGGKRNNWWVPIVFVGLFGCTPFSAFIGWRVSEAMSDADVRMMLGATYTLVVVGFAIGLLSAFVLAYSRLRSREELEDVRRDRDRMQTMVSMMGQQRLAYNIRMPNQRMPTFALPSPMMDAGMQQPYVTAGIPQQPVAVEYQEDEEVNLE